MNIATISKQIRAFADQLDATSEPEKPDPYVELKAAHAAGKVIESFNRGRGIWQYCPSPAFEGGTDYRIKPEEPAFQLPPPPPGMRWHREDGWKADDLPSGYRPLVVGEKMKQDSDSFTGSNDRVFETVKGLDGHFPMNPQEAFYRTTRPLTFEHAGKTWTWHRPGDPMPCDGERVLQILLSNGEANRDFARAKFWDWKSEDEESDVEIIGWRYAEPQTKTVPLGPEDVRCGDEITIDEYDDVRRQVLAVESTHIHLSVYGRIDYETLRKRQAKIRRRDSDEFVPCSKTLPA